MGHSEGFNLREPPGLAELARDLEKVQIDEAQGAGCSVDDAACPVEGGEQEAVQVWGQAEMGDADAIAARCLQSDGANAHAQPLAAEVPAPEAGEALYQRIGHLTRTLHDAMRELGYADELAGSRDNLPDARDRLAYIARLTGEAAEKVLNSVDRARTVQDELSGNAQSLQKRWAAVAAYTAAGNRATPAGAALVDETSAFFAAVAGRTQMTKEILTEIMMAQDFHDLTGQVIRRVVTLASELERQLVNLLIDASPVEQRRKSEPAAELEGPVVTAQGRTDVVTDQAGVDDLLASLGF